MSFKTFRRSWYSGAEVINCDDSDNTDYIFAFGKKYEYPEQSDWESHDVEASVGVPTRSYVDKVVIKAGNERVYELDTRQATGGKEKDTVSVLRLGYVSDGNMLDWRFKRNVAGHVGSMLIKYGETETGELWSHSVFHGLNDNIAFGMPVFDSCGEGLGYEYNDLTDQVFTESYGRVVDGSVLRRLLRDNTLKIRIEEVVGGNYIYNWRVDADNYFLDNAISNGNWETSDSNNNIFKFYETGIEASHNIDSGLVLEDTNSKLWRKEGKVFIEDGNLLLSLYDTNKLLLQDDNIVIANDSGDTASFKERNIDIKTGGSPSSNIHVDDEEIVLKLGGFSITIEDGSIVLEGGTPPSKIILSSTGITLQSAAGHKLEIGSSGLTFNGSALIYASLLDWLSQYSAMIGMGNMGAPVPLFPTTLSAFQIKNAIPAIPNTVLGFRTC